jgi:glycosyltransferase involved in cell wall biosynthesis
VAARAAEPVAHPWLAAGQPPVVLSVGRLGAAKDLETLVRAFARLCRRRPARLVVLGSERRPRKTEKRVAALRALAAELGVADHVDFVGYADNPFAWMARAGVLAVSSRNEGFCNVIAEALACGCPVVSTDCPSGPAEILDGGRYGRLVPVGDDVALAEALAATLAEPRDPERLRARGALFGIENAVRCYERLLWPAASSAA